jgi:hypothetical protein
MACGSKEAGGAYRPRHPQQTPFYQLVERFYPQFEAVYEERYSQDKTEHNAVGRFPEPGDDELLAGPSRNFQACFEGFFLCQRL